MMHRDLAARNILVFMFDAAGTSGTLVKITDYGYVRGHNYISHDY